MKKSVKKKLASMLLSLVKRYLTSDRGQKKVDGVRNMFKLMVAQVQDGIAEQFDDAYEIQTQIDDLLAEQKQLDIDNDNAGRLLKKLQEITD